MMLAIIMLTAVPVVSSVGLFTVKTKAAYWGSSNTKYAIVKKKSKYTATITAKKTGTAVITAVSDGRSYTCKITVINAYTWQNKTHKYQIIEKGMKWSDAKKYCEYLGGHLVVITSAKENEYLKKALKKYAKRNNYWLGAKKNSKGQFKWVNGEKFDYTDFAGGMPDRDNEKCLMIYRYDNPNTGADDTYKWNDLVNNGTFGSESWFGLDNFGFICEWD